MILTERGNKAISAVIVVAALMVGLLVAGTADAAHFKLHRGPFYGGSVSAFEFRTTKKRVERVFVRVQAKCDTGDRISAGASFGRPQGLPGTKNIPIQSNGRFAVNYEDRNAFGGGAIKMKGRVFKKRIRGRMSYRWFDNYFDSLCWSGKSVRKSWVRFSAKRLPPGTPWAGDTAGVPIK